MRAVGHGLKTSIRLGPGALRDLPKVWDRRWSRAAIVGDRTVIRLFGARVRREVAALAGEPLLLGFAPGEKHKTRRTKAMLEDRLLAARFPRDGVIIALGGGISLDVAGFVAATYMRGVDTAYVPTTLLAMVDAAIGGKTGVNASEGKNLVGAFHMPRAVLSDTDFLATLPPDEWKNGLAEVVKHAVVADRSFFLWLGRNADAISTPSAIDPHAIRRSAEIKTAIVSRDEREKGRRAVLNFGHTVGHAIERASGYSISHGRAVAAGMLVETEIATGLCGFPRADSDRLAALLCRLGFGPSRKLRVADLLAAMRIDKKGRRGEIRMSLPRRIGAMARSRAEWTVAVDERIVRRACQGTRIGEG
ncbi:MAG: 3-dehydroquinate synthase [Deltaproteobacteria bacterium]|nr:3-dehydroquinate synthase [Deltaproteobacteria bacterium]